MSKIVGIDLGTTNSAIAVRDGAVTTVIANLDGNRTTPSVVSFTDEGRLVGRQARAQAIIHPNRTLSSVKRLIGLRRGEVVAEEKNLPYALVGASDEYVQIEVDSQRYFPAQISAMILADLKRSAEKYLGEPVTKAVITVPAYFDNSRREATKEAGQIAGLEVVRIINEPTAAALAYGLDKKANSKIVVIDPGGGTFDVSVLSIGDGVTQVLATHGDTHLGGDDWDRALVDYVATEFMTTTGVDIRKDPMALQRLLEACEKAKCDLSTTAQTTINLPYITAVGGAPKHLNQLVTRAKFEAVCENLFQRLRPPIDAALQDAKLLPSQIDEVVMVGGTSRMPKILQMCREMFGKEPNCTVNPDEIVAIGAAIQGSVLSDDVDKVTGIVLLDVTPLTLGVETLGGIMSPLIQRNTTIPHHKSEIYTTAVENQPAVDVHVLQGERRLVSGNRTLGRFQLTGISPQPRGQPQIEVAFDVNADGIVSVTATDKTTGKKQQVEIKSSGGLSREQIDAMMKDAADHEAEESERVEMIETCNRGDVLAYGTEKFLKENEHLVNPQTASAVTATILSLKDALKVNSDRQALKHAIQQVESSAKRMYEEVYGAGQRAGAATPKPTTPVPSTAGVSQIGPVTGSGFKI